MNSSTTVALLAFSVAVLGLGTVIGLSVHFAHPNDDDQHLDVVKDVDRDDVLVDCWPLGFVNQTMCEKKGCTWVTRSDGVPWCTFPEGYGYNVVGDVVETDAGFRVNVSRADVPAGVFGNDIADLIVDIEYHTDTRVRVRIADMDGKQFVVPKEAVDIEKPTSTPSEDTRLYAVTIQTTPQFGFKIIRKSTGTTVFDATLPGLTFSTQYHQLSTRLPSEHVYGFGEHNHERFKHDMHWRKWAIFTRDVAPVDPVNLYGAQPMYMNIEGADGNANGVLLLNSNAMNIYLQPSPHPGISYRVIGGILDFYFFLGPTPENVVQQYTEATGRSMMPPYWSLGFQLSRWNYDNLTYVKEVVRRNREAGIPQDVQYGDIDIMESYLDFTYDKVKYDGLPEFADELHSVGMRYIVIQDHCIGSDESIHDDKLNGKYKPYDDGIASDIFIRNAAGDILEAEVWPGRTYYPDFSLPRAQQWWTDQCVDFYNGTDWGVEYDALWIDMNEPSSFIHGSNADPACEKNTYNYPPYTAEVLGSSEDGKLYEKTICMDSKTNWGLTYDTHNLYGHSMSIVSWNSLREMFPDKRPFVLTRSQFTGTQKYAQHWLGDNQSEWKQIPWSIIGMLEYSLFGFSYTGADICGFWYAATEELCQRWMQLGAFYPFARNHNADAWPDQDPAVFSDEMIRVSRDILLTRYKLLPFLYTLLHEAHTRGSTVVRPLMHEFPMDTVALSIDAQFLWGPSLLISPAMSQGQEWVNAWIPAGRWYDYYGGKQVEGTGGDYNGEYHNLHTPLDKINLHVRGGYIIPWQEPANTTVYSRRNPMGITVALGDAPFFEASGSLFWDDGESFDTFDSGNYLHVNFACSKPKTEYILDMTIDHSGYPDASALYFKTINVWGLESTPGYLHVDDVAWKSYRYDSYAKTIEIYGLSLGITKAHQVKWSPIY